MSLSVAVLMALAAGTFLLKAAGPVVLGNRPLPPRVASSAAVLPAALIAALVVTSGLSDDRSLTVDARAAGLRALWFHVVNAGGAWLHVDGAEPRHLQPRDFALVPHGEGHRIYSDPGAPWSVASLARETAMSRSAFAARFTELVGEPVMRYVTRWRMHVALDMLQQGDVSVAELAVQLGYDSEAAFSRAFKRTLGMSPGAARRSPPATLPEPLSEPLPA